MKTQKNENVPDWLLKEEDYHPKKDKESFIHRSILSLLRIISKMKGQDSYQEEKGKVNAVLKLAFTFLLLFMLSLSKEHSYTIIILVYCLVCLSIMQAESIKKILKMTMVVGLLIFIFTVPSIFLGHGVTAGRIIWKTIGSITLVGILIHGTSWGNITASLKYFHVPDLFIFLIDISFKYIVLLGEYTLQSLYALQLRSVGKNKRKYSSMGGIAGTLFLKSKEMTDEMYQAMQCRTFTGEYPKRVKIKWTIMDWIYVLLQVLLICLFFYIGR